MAADHHAGSVRGAGEDELEFLKSLGTHLVRVMPAGIPPKIARAHEVVDVERLYLPWLAGHKKVAALVRPDYYVFGFAKERADLPELVRELKNQLPLL